jgi:hypothetical protein
LEKPLPAGYRQGLITAITVLLGLSFVFFRYLVFDTTSGDWSHPGEVSAVLAFASISVQLFALWRALQVADDKIPVYNVTVRWFVAGVLLLGASLAVSAAISLGTAVSCINEIDAAP